MLLRFYKTNKDGKVLGKFYEIHRKKDNKVYIHYGPEPIGTWSLPIGKLEVYIFNNSENAKKFMERKINEKLKKSYKVEEINGKKSRESQIFKWMLKNAKPIVKNKTVKKKKTNKNKTRKGGTLRFNRIVKYENDLPPSRVNK